ncbi:MAG: sensor histidine kinase [Thermodesulfobacteriota bacterium]
MKFKSLKANIAVNIALLLLLAIGLTDFVLVQVIEKQLIRDRIDNGRLWLRQAADTIDRQNHAAAAALPPSAPQAATVFPFIDYAVFYNPEGFKTRVYGQLPAGCAPVVSYLKRRVAASGQSLSRFTGDSWGVFWRQHRYLVVAAPLPNAQASGVAVMSLSPVYQLLRLSHKVAFSYLALNFFVIFLIGVFRLSRLMTRPIQRFIKLTETFEPTGRFDLFPEKHHDEFSRLSTALNRMMQRIEDDQHKLQESLQSIENANRELKNAQQEMIRAEKLASIGRLSAGLAHEIGNPIGVILGYLGLIKNRAIAPDDAASMDYIERAETEINRINTIIRQLLDFSRSAPLAYTRVSVHELVSEVGRMLSAQPLTEEIDLHYDFNAETDMVYADYNQLHQVLVNLLINAADSIAMSDNPASGQIRITTDLVADSRFESGRQSPGCLPEKETMLELRVVDNGMGIHQDNIDKIFDPFFTTKDTGKGTGLGLSVCYMIIEQFGGTITAESTPGTGTAMVLRLPAAAGGMKENEAVPGHR